MNKYKVEFLKTQKYIVDVLADSQEEAEKKAQDKLTIISIQDMWQYYETGDENIEVNYVYDVTNTDDPFDSENNDENAIS